FDGRRGLVPEGVSSGAAKYPDYLVVQAIAIGDKSPSAGFALAVRLAGPLSSTSRAIATSGRRLMRCQAAQTGVVYCIHGTSRNTTFSGALERRLRCSMAMPRPAPTRRNAV